MSGLVSTATEEFFQTLARASIGAFEVGFNSALPETFPENVRVLARDTNIQLNLHLPFFFSWANQGKIDQSMRYLEGGARLASEVNGVAVFHLGHAGVLNFEAVRPVMIKGIRDGIEKAVSLNPTSRFFLGIETSGKLNELGSLEEIALLVSGLSSDSVIPIIDWSHMYARSNGGFPRSVSDYRKVIAKLEEISPKNFYFHGSGIEFKNFQEKRHLSTKTCAPPLPHLLEVLQEGGYEYTFIVESPNAIEDVLWLREVVKDPSVWIEFAERKMRESGLQVTLG